MLTKLDKMVLAAQKEKNLLENSLYQIKLNRHELYKQCKVFTKKKFCRLKIYMFSCFEK